MNNGREIVSNCNGNPVEFVILEDNRDRLWRILFPKETDILQPAKCAKTLTRKECPNYLVCHMLVEKILKGGGGNNITANGDGIIPGEKAESEKRRESLDEIDVLTKKIKKIQGQ